MISGGGLISSTGDQGGYCQTKVFGGSGPPAGSVGVHSQFHQPLEESKMVSDGYSQRQALSAPTVEGLSWRGASPQSREWSGSPRLMGTKFGHTVVVDSGFF